MKKFFEEFKTFITKGNVLDMAVGVIVGGAFGAITTALVNNIITPLLAALIPTGNADGLNFTLVDEVKDAAGVVTQEKIVFGLGTFLGAVLNFLIVAFVLFLVVKAFNKAREVAELKKKAEAEAAAAAAEPEEPKPTSEELLTAILDEIKKK